MVQKKQKKASSPSSSQTTNVTLHWKKRAFLAAIADGNSITAAAKVVGINRITHYDWLDHNEAYRAAYAQADQANVDALLAEARRRALASSDNLLMFLIKGKLPEYRETVKHDVGGDPSRPIKIEVSYGDPNERYNIQSPSSPPALPSG